MALALLVITRTQQLNRLILLGTQLAELILSKVVHPLTDRVSKSFGSRIMDLSRLRTMPRLRSRCLSTLILRRHHTRSRVRLARSSREVLPSLLLADWLQVRALSPHDIRLCSTQSIHLVRSRIRQVHVLQVNTSILTVLDKALVKVKCPSSSSLRRRMRLLQILSGHNRIKLYLVTSLARHHPLRT